MGFRFFVEGLFSDFAVELCSEARPILVDVYIAIRRARAVDFSVWVVQGVWSGVARNLHTVGCRAAALTSRATQTLNPQLGSSA